MGVRIGPTIGDLYKLNIKGPGSQMFAAAHMAVTRNPNQLASQTT